MNMKLSCIYASAALTLLCAAPGFGQSKAKAENVPEIAYDAVPGFIRMPTGLYLGEAIGVATNSKGHVFVYTRSERTRLFEFDQTGKYLRELGENLYGFDFGHAVRVDSQDNIWAVDEGTNMIIKFNPEGRVVMVLGHRPDSLDGVPVTPGFGVAPPPATRYTFSRPTDIGWDAAGNIFITDGYGNSRVAKYDKNGKFIKDTGSRGSGPGQLNTPHTMATDAKGNVYIGDRGNARIQVFDNDLTLKTQYDQVGNPWAMCISQGPHQYLYSSNSAPDNNNAEVAAHTGEIYKMELDGTILGRFGKAGKGTGSFSTIHELDCRNPNELYSAEITAWRVQKLIMKDKK